MAAEDEGYWFLSNGIGLLAGVATWIYAVMSWGFLIGMAFGWIPGVVVWFVVAFVWPVILGLGLLAGAALVLLVIYEERSNDEGDASPTAPAVLESRDRGNGSPRDGRFLSWTGYQDSLERGWTDERLRAVGYRLPLLSEMPRRSAPYVSKAGQRVYYRATCPKALNIPSALRVEFESEEAALATGRTRSDIPGC